MRRLELKALDGPESPAFSPDGKTVAFSALQGGGRATSTPSTSTTGRAHERHEGRVRRLRADVLARRQDASSTPRASAATTSCSARPRDRPEEAADVRHARRHRREVLSTTTRSCSRRRRSTRTCRSRPRSRATRTSRTSGRSTSRTGELRQWTDTVTGNVSPVVLTLAAAPARRVRLVLQGRERHPHRSRATSRSRRSRRATSASPGPIIDFTPPLSHTLVRDNIHKKGAFEKMSLAGRPPVGLGVTSGGNFYGNTQITFTDVLGDKQISFYAQSVVAVPDDGVHVRRTSSAGCSTRCRASRRISSTTARTRAPSTTRRSRRTSTATSPRPCRASAAGPPSGSTRSTATRASSCSAATCTCREHYTTPRCSSSPSSTRSTSTASRSSATAT